MEDILTVTQLTSAIKKILEGKFPFVFVKGEISNFKEQSSGHLYFTLKDQESQISAVLFKGNTRGLKALPKNGDQVFIKGEMSVYAPRGNYQVLVRELQLIGIGELLLKWHELKLKLEQKGWFAKEKKKHLPKHPKIIGVITSPTGAVIQDILNILRRRAAGFQLLLNPVRVQGDGAANEIAQAIEAFNHYQLADVLIVCRGGGSLEDLAPFNEEVVATAIHNSKIPIISAVGHETDYCIADYVADMRAPTPSAAAEIVMQEKNQLIDFFSATHARLKQSLSAQIKQHKLRLKAYKEQPVLSSPYAILGKSYQKLDDYRCDITTAVKHHFHQKKLKFLSLEKQIALFKPLSQVTLLRTKLQQLTAHLKSIDPKNLLKKGYCIPFAENKDSVILSTKGILQGQKIHLLMCDGALKTTVDEILKEVE
ncbi:MAG: exodeoxyribonuclease VII large subunit [Chlamydiota bacterium]